MKHSKIIIIGSGPAGTSVAWPLVKAGLQVLMIDAGATSKASAIEKGDLQSIRESFGPNADLFIDDDLNHILENENNSPKLRSPRYQYVFDNFIKRYNIKLNNFKAVGSLAKGGLSNAWGAVCYTFSPQEFYPDYSVYQALVKSYLKVALRIGISGPRFDNLSKHFLHQIKVQKSLALHPSCEYLFNRYNQQFFKNFTLGQPRTAVITEDFNQRKACQLQNMCLWGCSEHAIYNAADEIKDLKQYSNFTYLNDVFVDEIVKKGNQYCIEGTQISNNSSIQLYCDIIIVAAGTIGSTILTLKYTKTFNQPLRLLSNPCVASAYIIPKRLGNAITKKSFGMGQLAFNIDDVFGTVYTPEGLLANELINHLPFTRPNAIKLTKYLTSSMLLTNCFLPGSRSRNTLQIKDGAAHIEGKHVNINKNITKELRRSMRRLGAWPLPMSSKSTVPGSDIHYAGTLPMSVDPKPLTVNAFGELHGHKNYYIVDGSILSILPAKNLTFTIMANADRIGCRLAESLTTSQAKSEKVSI